MELSLPEMGNMAGGVGWRENIKVPIYLSLCLLLLPSLLAYLFSFIFIAPTFFFPSLCPCRKPTA